MSDYLQAGLCGIIGGFFSPICLLSAFLGGGMSVGTGLSITREHLSFKKSFALGGFCGLCTGVSALIFWYILFVSFQNSFSWFFTHSSGKKLLSTAEPHLWEYGLIHFFACIPLSICGALCSYALQEG